MYTSKYQTRMFRTCSTRPWKRTRMYPCRYTCVEDSTRMYRVRVSCIRNEFKGYRIYVLKANLVAKIGSFTRLHIIFRQIGRLETLKMISFRENEIFHFSSQYLLHLTLSTTKTKQNPHMSTRIQYTSTTRVSE